MADITICFISVCATIALGFVTRIVNIVFTYLARNDKNRPNSSN